MAPRGVQTPHLGLSGEVSGWGEPMERTFVAPGVCTKVLGEERNLGLTHRQNTSLKAPSEPPPGLFGLGCSLLYFVLKEGKAS